jgi:hypothetical protein
MGPSIAQRLFPTGGQEDASFRYAIYRHRRNINVIFRWRVPLSCPVVSTLSIGAPSADGAAGEGHTPMKHWGKKREALLRHEALSATLLGWIR